MREENLIARCIQNERSAQRELYESYKHSLYTIVYRLTGDKTISHDLLQETFIDAFKGLAKLKEHKYFYSWIRKILIRKTYGYLRTKTPMEDLDNMAEIVSPGSHRFDIEYIESAIQQLPLKSRTVFIMSAVEGFSHKEIGQALDISVGTSKSQLNYAKNKLKEILKPYLSTG